MPDTPESPEVEDLIRYDILAQEALRGVVKKVLQEIARTGLPGDHHFYITFDTQFAGVRMSSRMREKYPEEMTIVIQHQFWDLEATEQGFSIGLSFDNVPEALSIPFAAVRGFFDPSVQFGLQFEATDDDNESAGGQRQVEDSDDVSALPSPSKMETQADGDGERSGENGAGEDISDDNEDKADSSADVVSLDAFRKK
ncbi:MAG: SspB family protein [Rhizobiaceae bacterium]